VLGYGAGGGQEELSFTAPMKSAWGRFFICVCGEGALSLCSSELG
jgi:hypothetical protein